MNNNDLMSMLMGTLSDPAKKEKIMDIVSSLSYDQPKENSDFNNTKENNFPLPLSTSSPSDDFFNPEAISKIKGMLDNFGRTDDNRISLLNSIRPYMKSSRLKNIDMAIRCIQLINFASGLKN